MRMGKLLSFIIGIALLIGTVLFSGCASSTISYEKNVSVQFERVSSEDAHISEAHAYEDGDELVIYGKVKRAVNNCCDAARGYVDIAVIGPGGFILDVIHTLYSPRNIPKSRSRSSHFTTRLPYTPPDGVTIRITHHSS